MMLLKQTKKSVARKGVVCVIDEAYERKRKAKAIMHRALSCLSKSTCQCILKFIALTIHLSSYFTKDCMIVEILVRVVGMLIYLGSPR